MVTITVECVKCKENKELRVEFNDLIRWKNGELVQKAFPYLSPDDRELLISGICPTCWDRMWR